MKRKLSTFVLGFGIALAGIPGLINAASITTESEQVATVPTSDHRIDVTTQCYKGAAIFKITNMGEKLPTPFMFNIVRVNSNTVVSKRRLRLAAGQNVTFKIKNADKIPSDIGLRINAEGYQRDGQMHALVRCHT